jgi:hypothetical protein
MFATIPAAVHPAPASALPASAKPSLPASRNSWASLPLASAPGVEPSLSLLPSVPAPESPGTPAPPPTPDEPPDPPRPPLPVGLPAVPPLPPVPVAEPPAPARLPPAPPPPGPPPLPLAPPLLSSPEQEAPSQPRPPRMPSDRKCFRDRSRPVIAALRAVVRIPGDSYPIVLAMSSRLGDVEREKKIEGFEPWTQATTSQMARPIMPWSRRPMAKGSPILW